MAVTSRESFACSKALLRPMKSRHDDPPSAPAEEAEERRGDPTSSSDETPASFPVIRRSYQPVADVGERLRRLFAILSLPPQDWFSCKAA
jgi:hypothetical protein